MERLISVIVCLLLAVPCTAEIITVDDDGIADFNSIQLAIDSANDEDIVIVQPGLYEEDINFLGKNITLTSINPQNPNIVAATIIDCDYQYPWDKPAVMFRGTEDANCVLTGFRINGCIMGFDSSVNPAEEHTHATINNCLLQGNCLQYGTVIKACDGVISNCMIADNCSTTYTCFPAIYKCHGLIKNCTIANCGGVGVGDDDSTTIQDCIICRNRDVWSLCGAIQLGSGAALNISYCDVVGGLDAISLEDSNCIINWGPGNIDTDPCFIREGYWDFNEWPIIVFEGDYHLQCVAGRWDPNSENWVTDANTSACIDAGNPGCPPGSEPLPNGSRINMGAYGGTPTASKSPADWHSIADLTNDWAVDFSDLAIFVDYWLNTGRCIPSDLNRSQSVDFSDFDIFADNWLW